MHIIYFGLGSNLGNKEENLYTAISQIDEEIGEVTAVSTFHTTKPVGYDDQPDFYNAACKAVTDLAPREVLDKVETIMRDMGRIRNIPNGPRIIDIDILLYDDLVFEEEGLSVPHPRMLDRLFVLGPLCEIGDEVVHPVSKKKIEEHLEELKEKS
ncbi:MAG: 2-amino-4-hydroxy-6-hydroxymethyldihydropteridine diphosphokinase [Candidatus Pacebacteria bacterium]|jgi:2-amino-4-hydroxy-6-hydroxymethyldihydropteridine diphosphokinase|nr:2-amino-4-hydroxy-6-hydroxymethyldihydropteridine diphosphokinase [Candidatus Paceibacterota bacterium]